MKFSPTVYQNFAKVMHQSIPAAHSPSPRWPPGISVFFALDGKFPGVETLELSNPPRWGRKKRANAPSSDNTATFFIDSTFPWLREKRPGDEVEIVPFSAF